MNKLKFNAGGQPVYLDDLNVLQELPSEYASAILRGLLTSPDIEGEIKKFKAMFPFGTENKLGYFLHFYPKQIVGNRWRFDPGCIFLDGEILDFAGGDFDLVSGSPFYVIVHNDPLNVRTLDNGSQESCGVSRYAEISARPSETLPSYPSSQLGDLMDTIFLKIRAKLNGASEEWIPLQVYFYNGYSGTVEYRELTDCYRIRIDIHSVQNSENVNASIQLFEIGSDWPGGYRDIRSGLFGAGGDDVSHTAYISFGDRTANLNKLDSVTGFWSPRDCSVKTIFDIPK